MSHLKMCLVTLKNRLPLKSLGTFILAPTQRLKLLFPIHLANAFVPKYRLQLDYLLLCAAKCLVLLLFIIISE